MKFKLQRSPLSEAISLVIDYRGKTPKKLGSEWSSKGYRALSAKNIKTGRIVQQDNIKFVDSDLYQRWMKDEIRRGDILITSEAPFGEVLIWNSDEKIVLSQRLFGLRCKEGFYPPYVYHYMTSPQFQEELRARATGTTVPGLRQPELLKCSIQYPGYLEQKRIADTLSALDNKIASNTKINHHLEQIAHTSFRSWFVDFEPTKPFTEVAQVLGGGTPKTTNNEYWNGPIPFFTPKDTQSLYVLATEKTLTEAGLSCCNSPLYPKNTVFVTARGTVGKVAIAGVPMAMNQSCYALIGKSGYGQHFVYHLALEAVESLKHKASGAVFDAIVTRDFESEMVVAPPVDAVDKFEKKIKPIYDAFLNNANESVCLATLRDTLLPRLMSGELLISDIATK